jgi:hypothetical protein
MSAYGLRDANAYILVFDLLCPDSFDYITGMFAQINESRDLEKIPVVVVGNKTDKVNDNIYKSRMKGRDSEDRKDLWERDHNSGGGGHGGHGGGGGHFGHGEDNGFGGGHHGDHGDHGSFGHFGGFGGGGHGGHHDHFGSSSKKKHKDKKGRHGHSSSSSSHGGHGGHSSSSHHSSRSSRDKHSRHNVEINWTQYSPDEYLDKDIADKVTSEWKAIYKECSAKDTTAVTDIFKSVMGVFEEVGVEWTDDEEHASHNRPKMCAIL